MKESTTPPQFVNPFFEEDEDDLGKSSEIINPLLEDDQDEEEAPFKASEPSPRERVQANADRPVDPALSVSNGVSAPAAPSDTVIVEKRGKRFIESDFKRKNIEEVVVKDETVPPKKRNKHVLPNGRMNGAELEFFRNLKVAKSDTSNERLMTLRGRVDGIDTPAAKKARNLLYNQAIDNPDALSRGNTSRFSAKDEEILVFLAQFRYAKADHLAAAFSRAVRTIEERLKKMRQQGLVIDKKVYGTRPVWFLTEAGMLLSGYDLPRVTDAKMSMMLFSHQFAVNHVAANLLGANVNVLNLTDFPALNRLDAKGNAVRGETLVSELQISSSFGKIKGFEKAEVFVPGLKSSIDRDFARWEKLGGVEYGRSPEQYRGNEHLYALMPPSSHRLAYHMPDLVVERERAPDGSPESIAIEVEISTKDSADYLKTLKAYEADKRFFKKVVWVCKGVGAARRLEKAAKDSGLWQQGRISIVPIITEHGIYKERDLWFL